MNPTLQKFIDTGDRKGAPSQEAIRDLLETYPALPQDYVDVVRKADGAQGWISEHSYLVLYSLEELYGVNKAACADEFAPGMVIFGGNGGGMTYGFDTRCTPPKIVEVPDETLCWDEIWTVWDSFDEFVEELATRDS